jgi:hypothetical protein
MWRGLKWVKREHNDKLLRWKWWTSGSITARNYVKSWSISLSKSQVVMLFSHEVCTTVKVKLSLVLFYALYISIFYVQEQMKEKQVQRSPIPRLINVHSAIKLCFSRQRKFCDTRSNINNRKNISFTKFLWHLPRYGNLCTYSFWSK